MDADSVMTLCWFEVPELFRAAGDREGFEADVHRRLDALNTDGGWKHVQQAWREFWLTESLLALRRDDCEQGTFELSNTRRTKMRQVLVETN